MRLTRRNDDVAIAEHVETARGLARRLVGLIGRREFAPGSALMIPACGQVHTFLVRFPIDVIFLDAENRILCVEANVRPYRVTKTCPGARMAIELPAGTIAAHGLRPEDEVMMSEE
jgi:uncharacterized membrane protein (UPF0127 family)